MLLYIQLMSNPWLDHVAQWRKQYGNGLTYKQVLIEARKSYTPVKKGSGLSASRPPTQHAAAVNLMAGSGFKDLPKNLRKPARDADRFLRENIKQPIRKAFDPSFRTKKERERAQQEEDEYWAEFEEQQKRRKAANAANNRENALRLEALKVIGANDGDSYAVIRTKYRKMSLKLHPDKGGDIEDFKELNAAMQFIDGLYGN
jgi:curved DNA-binding protein CbpA